MSLFLAADVSNDWRLGAVVSGFVVWDEDCMLALDWMTVMRGRFSFTKEAVVCLEGLQFEMKVIRDRIWLCS